MTNELNDSERLARTSQSIDPRVLDVFVESARRTVEGVGLRPLSELERSYAREHHLIGDILAEVSLEGPNGFGSLLVGFEQAAALAAATELFQETYTEIDEVVESMVAEITNQIVGQAKRDLQPLGYSVNMAVPQVRLAGQQGDEGIRRDSALMVFSHESGALMLSVDLGKQSE